MELIKRQMEMRMNLDEDMNQSIDMDNIKLNQMYCRIIYHDRMLWKKILIHSNLFQFHLEYSDRKPKNSISNYDYLHSIMFQFLFFSVKSSIST